MSQPWTVFQIEVPREQYGEVNRLGWGALDNPGMEQLRAKQALQLEGYEDYEPWMRKYFKPVAIVEAESLDHVFELTNLWNDQEKVDRLRDLHSTSVGDMILDGVTGKFWMVDGCGFSEVA